MSERKNKSKEINTTLGKSSSSLRSILDNANKMNTIKLGEYYHIFIMDAFTDTLYKYNIHQDSLDNNQTKSLDAIIEAKENLLKAELDDKDSNEPK